MKEIESMLSSAAQEYYGGMYIDFQKTVSEPDSKFYKDYEMICSAISEKTHNYIIVDIGSGSCRWFNLFEHEVKKYFAIEVNTAALAAAPTHSKLIPINQNVFDKDFNLLRVIKSKIDMAFFGFFLSHFTNENIQVLLKMINSVNRIIIIDSFWGSAHQVKYATKELRDIKRRFSATERVFVPKRFFEPSDIESLIKPFGYRIKKFVSGKYWFVCIAEK
jgi:hypothetical protein